MSINFPSSLDSLSNPTSTDLLDNASAALDHWTQHSDANDAIEALEAKVGVDGSAVTTTFDYKLSEVTSTDKAVGKTATQTLTNKTLTSPTISGGTATGVTATTTSVNGVTLSTSAGTTTFLRGDGTYVAPTAGDASYAAKGSVQGLTDAATSGLTLASGVISVNSGTSANNIVKLDASAKLPAVDGSQLTNLPVPVGAAGTAVAAESLGEVSSNSASYTKVKEIVCGKTGTFTIYFEIKAQSTYTAYGRIYKNGSAVGTERSTTSTSYVGYSEDVSFVYGDLIQIYAKNSTGGVNMNAKNFQVKEYAWQVNI